jgi:hypothetical protein
MFSLFSDLGKRESKELKERHIDGTNRNISCQKQRRICYTMLVVVGNNSDAVGHDCL